MLAGGSYLDLVPLFSVATSALYLILDDFLDWVLASLEFPLVKWLQEGRWDALQHLANQFATRSDGVIDGVFGALDGLAARIRCPTLKEVPDPGNYYCRKGFYALNVQAICDRLKRFLWSYPSNKGSAHDSSAWANSRLCELLKDPQILEELRQRRLFLVGDSAYALALFMLIPFEVSEIQGHPNKDARDAFNFYLSSCRIHIECAFGELVMRWGILWRSLRFSLAKSIKVINVCMLLHNFIVDHRQGDDTEDRQFFRQFQIDMDQTQVQLTRITGEVPRVAITDNNGPRPAGRPTGEDNQMKEEGRILREYYTLQLQQMGMKRPLQNDMRRNSQGNVYLVGS